MSDALDLFVNATHADGTEREEKERVPYREAIGVLMYIGCKTRPDIAYAIKLLVRLLSDPCHMHWKGVKRIMRYWKVTHEKKNCTGNLATNSKYESDILACSDSDFTGNTKD